MSISVPQRGRSAPAKSTDAIIFSSVTKNSSKWRRRANFWSTRRSSATDTARPEQPVLEALAAGRDVLFDIDWQGTQQLRQQVREDVVTIFVLPPSREELERRLRAARRIPPTSLRGGWRKPMTRLSHWAEYDYIIVNEELNYAQVQVETILRAERLKRARQPGIPDFVETLMRSP